MRKIREFFAHKVVRMALFLGISTGCCIVVMAYFSKRIFSEPISSAELSLPAVIAMIFEVIVQHEKLSRLNRPWIGVLVVLIPTLIILAVNG